MPTTYGSQSMSRSNGRKLGPTHSSHEKGFTLVELLIVMALSGLILTGIYSVFVAQQRAHATNTQVVQMQQNLRAALAIMERDIRMAGYSPSGNADVGFAQAMEEVMQLTVDLNDDGDATDDDEDITYGLDAGAARLGRDRSDGSGMQPIARNIRSVYFAYAFDDDQDGELDVDGSGEVIWATDSTDDGVDSLDLNVFTNAALAGGSVDLDRIRAVRIWLLARSEKPISNYADNKDYEVGRRTISGNGEAFLHRLVETTIKCRNMIF